MEDFGNIITNIKLINTKNENNINKNIPKAKSQSRTEDQHSIISSNCNKNTSRNLQNTSDNSKRFFIVQEVSVQPSANLYPFVYNYPKENKKFFFENSNIRKILVGFRNSSQTNSEKIIEHNLKKKIECYNQLSNEKLSTRSEDKTNKLSPTKTSNILKKHNKNLYTCSNNFTKGSPIFQKKVNNNSQKVIELPKMNSKNVKNSGNNNNFSVKLENISLSRNIKFGTPDTKKMENGKYLSNLKKNRISLSSIDSIKKKNIIQKTKNGREESLKGGTSEKNDYINKSEKQSLDMNYLRKNIVVSGVYSLTHENNGKSDINEDAFIVKENIFNEKFNFYGIFDGHGENSYLISKFIAKDLGKFFSNKTIYQKHIYKLFDNTIDYSADEECVNKETIINSKVIKKLLVQNDYYLIKDAIKNVENKLIERNYNLKLSGSTSLLLFLIKNLVVCANVGDSKCVLFKYSENKWSYINLSTEHSPDLKSEKTRIFTQGGEIHPTLNEKGIAEDNVQRIWRKNENYPGLAISRTIGDLIAKKIGVISNPSVIYKKLDLRSKFIILGTSSFWNVVNSTDIITTIKKYLLIGDANSAAKSLVEKAKKYWSKIGKKRDDVTVLVIFIHPY